MNASVKQFDKKHRFALYSTKSYLKNRGDILEV